MGKHQLVEIEKVVLHPDHSEVDIGLIKLKQKVPIDEKVMPICLPSKDYAKWDVWVMCLAGGEMSTLILLSI